MGRCAAKCFTTTILYWTTAHSHFLKLVAALWGTAPAGAQQKQLIHSKERYSTVLPSTEHSRKREMLPPERQNDHDGCCLAVIWFLLSMWPCFTPVLLLWWWTPHIDHKRKDKYMTTIEIIRGKINIWQYVRILTQSKFSSSLFQTAIKCVDFS